MGMNWRLAMILPLLAGVLMGAEADAEQPAAEQGEGVTEDGDITVEDHGYIFNPPDESIRRDVFYSLVSEIAAKKKLEELKAVTRTEGDRQEDSKGVKPITSESLEEVERVAGEAVSLIKSHFRSEDWERAIDVCNTYIAQLSRYQESYPDSRVLAQSLKWIRASLVTAEEKRIYEQAREHFEKLDLKIEGIIWSTDSPSLAIISGADGALGVNERIKDCVIKNIDTNRVDFMFPFMQRRFHFQLYLEPED